MGGDFTTSEGKAEVREKAVEIKRVAIPGLNIKEHATEINIG